MIFINGNWHQVNNLDEAMKIVEENLGKEFTEKLSNLIVEDKNSLTENYEEALAEIDFIRKGLTKIKSKITKLIN